MARHANRSRRLPSWPSLYICAVFVAFGAGFWALTGELHYMVTLPVLGLMTGSGMLVFARARPRRRRWGARLSLLLVGGGLFAGVGVLGRQSFQIEGLWFYLLHGVLGGVVVHYLVAKLLGPLLIGRTWCSWGCWTWMVLDYLPYHRSPHRPRSAWSWLQLAHLALSLGLVLVLWFGVGYRHGTEWSTTHGLLWYLAGNGFYYALAVTLAVLLKENRAFCKYACPVSVLLRASSRLSLLKVRGDPARCDDCGACTRACPMDVAVSSWARKGSGVLDPQCTLCQTCVASCPRQALALSIGIGGAVKSETRTG